MVDIRTLFQQNYSLVEFVYGLCFFVLGLAIALQSREHSRLELARSMPWLAVFGFTHALNEWGDLFIPLQRVYMDPAAITILRMVQLVLLASSFACLLEFGIRLLHPTFHARAWHIAPIGLFVAWLLAFLLLALSFPSDQDTWIYLGKGLARYMVGFPGALVAACGLWRYVSRHLLSLQVPHVARMLRIAAIALALYAVFSGLIPRPMPFFPGNWINGATFAEATAVPPELIRSALGLVLTLAIIRALDVFALETLRFIETVEQEQVLAIERERIARELHDGVIQKVYSAGLLIEAGRRRPETLENRLDRTLLILNDAVADLRRGLGDLRAAPSNQSVDLALKCIAEDPRYRMLVDIVLDVDIPDAPAYAHAPDVMAIVSEALSNVARHARAEHVRIQARRDDGHLRLSVQDDGIGLARPLASGQGLRNMQERARMLGGQVHVVSAGKGTTVDLVVPWEDES